MLFVLLAIPFILTVNAEVSQVRGELTAELKPGDTEILKWQFISDETTTLKLDALGEISQFLSFPNEVTLKDGTNTVEVVANIPKDYSDVDTINGKLRAVPSDPDQISGFLKSVTLVIETPDGSEESIKSEESASKEEGGGCLIATAAYGTELAPQVQFLREIRDNTVMSTASGAAFMTGFNQFYYSFSPVIADMERENPLFQETVRAFITPMVSTLSIMTLAEDGSEIQVLGLGISLIMLNIGMYIAVPAIVSHKVHKYIKAKH